MEIPIFETFRNCYIKTENLDCLVIWKNVATIKELDFCRLPEVVLIRKQITLRFCEAGPLIVYAHLPITLGHCGKA